jgi:hypothetical protein
MPIKKEAENLTNRGRGRPKGVRNKTTTVLKDAILLAAEKAGGKAGVIGYLTEQAKENPPAFMALMGKVIPLQVTGKDDGPIQMNATISPASKVREMVKQIAERS